MLEINLWQDLRAEEKKQKLTRPKPNNCLKQQVEEIIATVRAEGDTALLSYTQLFDGVKLPSLQVPAAEIRQAEIAPSSMNALISAVETISIYHEETFPKPQQITTTEGITIDLIYRPLEKIGLYVPGGNSTPLVSSLLMQALPAKIAGCPIKILCTPPNRSGCIDPHILVAARLCEVETIYQIGGAQAIAAMAYGTESITKVDKIFGPGNRFVTEAKSQVMIDPNGAAIDMPAGPSEVMIIADDRAYPDFIAADLLAQAEHGVDSQVILICQSEGFAKQVQERLVQQLANLSRKKFILEALKHSCILVCENVQDQITIANEYAPEHLILNCTNFEYLLAKMVTVGTIFVGQWAAETLGDYITGSNHVLPTNGYARNYSGLGTMDFLKRFTVQNVTQKGLHAVGEAAQILATIEGLDAHANAVKLRMDYSSSASQSKITKVV
jgi:histidinol dehydrogenase